MFSVIVNVRDPLKLTLSWYCPLEIAENVSITIEGRLPAAPVAVPTTVPAGVVSDPVKEDGVGVPDKATSLMFNWLEPVRTPPS
jgi:hypothetical protein